MNVGKGIFYKTRYTPSLIDKLRDDDPSTLTEKYEGVTLESIKKSVLRDVMALLNTKSKISKEKLENTLLDKSVINYGLDDISGQSYFTTDLDEVVKEIKETLIKFEPRIIADTIKIKAKTSDKDKTYSVFFIEISGILKIEPYSEAVCIDVRYETDSGKFI